MLSPICSPALLANDRGSWNLNQNQACVEYICASQESVERGNKRYPARGKVEVGGYRRLDLMAPGEL